jgi:hypothetical protein
MARRGPEFVVRTRDETGRLGEHRVDWVIGGKRMQDPVTVLSDGRWQVLPVYYHVTGKGEWVDYNEAKQGAVTPSHPFFWTNFRRTANRECLDCHSTGLDVRYETANHTWTTAFVDAGVACENCHGPGGRHAASKEKADIVQPRDIDPELGLAICGACHGPRKPDAKPLATNVPLGQVESLGLPFETQRLVFTPGLLAHVFDDRVDRYPKPPE